MVPTMTIEMPEAMIAYSTEVAPRRSPAKWQSDLRIVLIDDLIMVPGVLFAS